MHVAYIMHNVFTASVGTSSMMWAMVELNRKLEVLQKVQDEIHAAVGGRDRVHLDDMPKLRHLKWVEKETPCCTFRHVSICSYNAPTGTREGAGEHVGDRQGPDRRLGEQPELYFTPPLRHHRDGVPQQTSNYAKVQLAIFHQGYLYVLSPSCWNISE